MSRQTPRISTPTLARTTPAERLVALGVPECDAESVADDVDLYKVEALVLVRNCPLDLALRIARLDAAPCYTN